MSLPIYMYIGSPCRILQSSPWFEISPPRYLKIYKTLLAISLRSKSAFASFSDRILGPLIVTCWESQQASFQNIPKGSATTRDSFLYSYIYMGEVLAGWAPYHLRHFLVAYTAPLQIDLNCVQCQWVHIFLNEQRFCYG